MIHFPAVVCTSSPSTTNSLGVRSGLDPQRTTQDSTRYLWGSRVACRGQRRYFSGALLYVPLMLVSTFRMEDDQTPYVFSMPPHIDSEGDEVAAYVSVRPFGKDSRDVAINMSIDEAEELARQLVAVVTDAREGRFSEHGVKVAEDMRLQDLKEAWLVQGIEDLNNGG